MKQTAVLWPLIAVVLLAWSGCAKKSDVQAQTDALEKAFPGLAAAVAARNQAVGQAAPEDAKACVVAAMSAASRRDFAVGVIMLSKAVRTPGLSPEQIMAVQEVKRAWVIDLTNRAAKGEESAKAALAVIEDAR
jgi:hypothetical protein